MALGQIVRNENISPYHSLDSLTDMVTESDHGNADIRTFQDVLRKFPPRPNKDGYTLELKDVPCADCDAIFSSR